MKRQRGLSLGGSQHTHFDFSRMYIGVFKAKEWAT